MQIRMPRVIENISYLKYVFVCARVLYSECVIECETQKRLIMICNVLTAHI